MAVVVSEEAHHRVGLLVWRPVSSLSVALSGRTAGPAGLPLAGVDPERG